jgi:AhpD family alkylhydroperoxidase
MEVQVKTSADLEDVMQARIESPAVTVPGAIQALQRLAAAVRHTGIPDSTVYLVQMRASQINGCAVCLDMHSREMKQAGEPDERLATVAAWREAPYFTDAERAALALTEAATRIADRSDAVPDDVWDEAARHYDETQLAGLVLAITSINAWNLINVTTRQVTGDWVNQWINTDQAAS